MLTVLPMPHTAIPTMQPYRPDGLLPSYAYVPHVTSRGGHRCTLVTVYRSTVQTKGYSLGLRDGEGKGKGKFVEFSKAGRLK